MGEGDIFIQPKASEERDGEDDAERGDMRGKGYETEVEHLMAQKEVVNQEVKYPIEHHIACSANTVTEELHREKSAERTVEKVNNLRY